MWISLYFEVNINNLLRTTFLSIVATALVSCQGGSVTADKKQNLKFDYVQTEYRLRQFQNLNIDFNVLSSDVILSKPIKYSCTYDNQNSRSRVTNQPCTDLAYDILDERTGVFNWTPKITQDGEFTFYIVGHDGDRAARETLFITVTNQHPQLYAPNLNQVLRNGDIIRTIDINDIVSNLDVDADQDKITYHCEGASFSICQNIYNHNPKFADDGIIKDFAIHGREGEIVQFRIVGTDIYGLTGHADVKIKLQAANHAPSYNIPSGTVIDFNIDTQTPLMNPVPNFKITDADGDTIDSNCIVSLNDGVYESCDNIPNLSFVKHSGEIYFAPTYDQVGRYNFQISFTDDLGFSKYYQDLTILVDRNNRAPILEEIGDVVADKLTKGRTSITFPINFYDLDKSDTVRIAITPTNHIKYDQIKKEITITDLSLIDNQIYSVKACDNRGGCTTKQFEVYKKDIFIAELELEEAEELSLPTPTSKRAQIEITDTFNNRIELFKNRPGPFISTERQTVLVKVSGELESINTKNLKWNKALTKVISLGDLNWKDLSHAFQGTARLESFNFGNTSHTTKMNEMFRDSNVRVIDFAQFQDDELINASGMFYNAKNLSLIDLKKFDSGKLQDMSYMLAYTAPLQIELIGLNTTNVTNMEGLFAYMDYRGGLSLQMFRTEKVTNFSKTFAGLSRVSSWIFGEFNTANATTMEGMFKDCTDRGTLDISLFNTSKVVNFAEMFSGADFGAINLSSIDTSSASTFRAMFKNMNNITELNLNNFDPSQVNDMSEMFMGISSVDSLSLPLDSFLRRTANLENMDSMFEGMTRLIELDLNGLNSTNVRSMQRTFANDVSLVAVDFTNFAINPLGIENTEFNENTPAAFYCDQMTFGAYFGITCAVAP